jgi:hypothetical protein
MRLEPLQVSSATTPRAGTHTSSDRRSMTRRLGILDVLIGYPARPTFGVRAAGSWTRRGQFDRRSSPPSCRKREAAPSRSERLGVVSAVAEHDFRCCCRRPRRTVFSFAGYVRVLRGLYHARYRAVAGRADTGEARDNRAGRDAPEPAVEDAEHRLVRAGYSGHDVPTRHGSPGPKLTSIAANDARVRGRGWRAHGSMKWSAGWLTHCTRLDAAEVAAVGYLDAT